MLRRVPCGRDRVRPALPSLLPNWLGRWLRSVLAVTALMLADSLYLLLVRLADWARLEPFALGSDNLPVLYQVLLLGHTGMGLALALLAAIFVVAHLPKVRTRFSRGVVTSGGLAAGLAAAVAATGMFILTEAANRTNAWVWWLHVLGAGALLAAYAVHRIEGLVRFRAEAAAAYSAGVCGVAAALFLAHGLAGIGQEPSAAARISEAGAGDAPRQPDRTPVGWVAPESRFFPSPATTAAGGFLRHGFLTASTAEEQAEVRREAVTQGFASGVRTGAGECVSCHQDVTEQWASSAHRFASFNNPFYEASVEGLRRSSDGSNRWIARHAELYYGPTTESSEDAGEESTAGIVRSKWCAGCHDPALLFSGAMDASVDRASAEAQAGLTCLACHAIDTILDRTGNGNYRVTDRPEPYLFSSSEPGSASRYLRDAALKARPEPHRRAMKRPFFETAEYCAACHKVSLSEPVNNYRWLRGQNEFDVWDDSGVALNAARTFYLPGARRSCRDCHMPLETAPMGDLAADRNGMVRSHRFLAANTALPHLRGDTATLRLTEGFLENVVRVDVFAVRWGPADVEEGARELGDEAMAPPGVPLTIDVVVRNLDVGHTFPGGTNDSNEAWLEVTLETASGERLAASGLVSGDGRVDPGAHFFRTVALDSLGERITRRNPQDIRATVYSNLVPPGGSDLAHYRTTLPESWAGEELTFAVRLLWRKFDRDFTEFAYRANPQGFARFASVPELPISEVAADAVRLTVTRDPPAELSYEPGDDWVRWNDYGVALLLEGDTRRATAAFGRVEELAPDRVDGALNLARAALASGDIGAAYDALERAERVEAGNPRTAWVWALALGEDGLYDRAASALRRVLRTFPRDRASWRELGRTLYLDGRFEEALQAFAEVLSIDPEDRVAHYHAMLSLRALGREDEAEFAEAAYLRYSIDESAQELALAYRARDEGANAMAQPIPVHPLVVDERSPR